MNHSVMINGHQYLYSDSTDSVVVKFGPFHYGRMKFEHGYWRVFMDYETFPRQITAYQVFKETPDGRLYSTLIHTTLPAALEELTAREEATGEEHWAERVAVDL